MDAAQFSPSAHASQISRQARLALALERGQFRLWFQPVVSLHSGEVVGFEGLARWHDRDGGVLGPSAFVDAVERGGLYVPFTDEMINQAVEFAAACGRFGHDPSVSVNLGARSLEDPGLGNRITAALERHGVGADRLVLELTERELEGDPERALTALTELRSVGVSLSIDDFGTGYSSLDRLRRLPFDEVKIDRSFVQGIGVHAESLIIVESMIRLAKLLHLSVVAEGIECPEQLDVLRDAGCDRAQGFLFGRPMPAAQAGALLDRKAAFVRDAQRVRVDSSLPPSPRLMEIIVEADDLDNLLVDGDERSIAAQVLRALPLPVFIKGVDGRFIWSNESHLQRVGVGSLDEIRHRTDLDVHHPIEAMAYRSDDLHVLTTGEPIVDRHEEQTRPDGTISRLRTSKFPIRDSEGTVVGLLGFYAERGAEAERWLGRDLELLSKRVSPLPE